MPNDQIRFWLETLASVAGIAALVFIALELLRARRADARDFLFEIYEKYENLSEERKIADSIQFSTLDERLVLLNNEPEALLAFGKVYDFWDLLTKTVRDQAIGKKIALEHFGAPFVRWYSKYASSQREWVALADGIPYFDSFEWFNDELQKMYPGEKQANETRTAYRENLANTNS